MQALSTLALVAVLGGGAHAKPRADRREEPFVGDELGPGDLGFIAPPRKPVPVPDTPDPAIAKLGRERAGTWSCKGVTLASDGSSRPVTTRLTIDVALAGGWIRIDGTATTKGETPVRFAEYQSYDGIARQWTSIGLTSRGARVVATSLGEERGEWTWTGPRITPGATVQVRRHQQLGKDAMSFWTEAFEGGAWRKLTESTCRRQAR